jgi:hypothetical protein
MDLDPDLPGSRYRFGKDPTGSGSTRLMLTMTKITGERYININHNVYC